MKSFLSERERKELQSLKKDLVNPVKTFVGEVYNDTVGDAKKFYSDQAKKTKQKAELVRERTEEQMAILAQRRENQKRQKKAWVKKAVLTLLLILAIVLVFLSAALSARAEEPDFLSLEEPCLTLSPPDLAPTGQFYTSRCDRHMAT